MQKFECLENMQRKNKNKVLNFKLDNMTIHFNRY